ncbi:MAG: ATP-dependent helicase [Nitrososphaerales archaeon]
MERLPVRRSTRSTRKNDVLNTLDPVVGEWFSRFKEATPPQKYAIPLIQAKKNVLIASPTGSGKTLAAFLSVLDELVKLGKKGDLEERIYCLYVSPLRALSYDIYKNLVNPLEEMTTIAKSRNIEMPEIKVGIRTGDTSQSERSKMLRKPPHILITTPESLAIILCAPKFREHLKKIKWVIIDEIHEVCSSKRGLHLSLSLERLHDFCNGSFARIGLSATIHPLKEVALFLVGMNKKKGRNVEIIDERFVKATELTVTSPVSDLVHSSSRSASSKMYSSLKELVKSNRTTLIFTNTRSGTERVVYQLSKMNIVDADELAAHHSSLSRDSRREVEDKLKEGRMRAVVTSTSLELGIDIGSIDVVAQVGSPKSISRCLQRVGRSGHALDRVSKGVLIAMDRDDLVEDAVIAREAMRGELDRVYIPGAALDVLSQHVVGMAVERIWTVKEAFDVVKSAYPYRNLTKRQFGNVIKYLSGGYEDLENYRVYGKIWYDASTDSFGRRGFLLRVIYATNIGTIPDEVAVRVYTGEKKWVGQIEEEFLERLTKGDIFVLGGRTYEFLYVKEFNAFVKPAYKGKPTVPSWFSEMLPLSFDLGEAIGRFRNSIFEKIKSGRPAREICEFISKDASCTSNGAKAIYGYIKAENDFFNYIGVTDRPNNTKIIIQSYIDRGSKQNLIFNCVFGRRVHDALSRAYAHILSVKFKCNVIVTVGDTGFVVTLPKGKRVEPILLLDSLTSQNIKRVLVTAVKKTEMVRRRFRHCGGRALMILRNYKGHRIRVAKQQMNSQLLITMCEKLDGFPVLEETYREVIEDLMDIQNAKSILMDVESGKRSFVICPEARIPSPFSHDLILSGYSDVILMTDKKELLKNLYDTVLAKVRKGGVSGKKK